MTTLGEVARELDLRRKELRRREAEGYGEEIRGARESVAEFEQAFVEMTAAKLDRIAALAGHVELGELPTGLGLILSESEDLAAYYARTPAVATTTDPSGAGTTGEMEFRPRNRTGVPPLGERVEFPDDGVDRMPWFVDDIDHHGTPIAYGSPRTTLRILPDRDVFVLCTDRGAYLKWPTRQGEGKGRTRRFPSLTEAAHAAEHAVLNGNTIVDIPEPVSASPAPGR